MEYFGEDPASDTCLGVCCDVCMEEMELQDQQQHMAVILQAAAEIPGNGELKVQINSVWRKFSSSQYLATQFRYCSLVVIAKQILKSAEWSI